MDETYRINRWVNNYENGLSNWYESDWYFLNIF